MRYLHRDKEGNVLGHYACLQPGYAEEAVPDNDPVILAWYAKREADITAYEQQKTIMGNEVLYQEIQALKAKVAELIAASKRV